MRDIRVSAEVEALVGAEELRQLNREPFDLYTCRECGQPGHTTEPTVLMVESYKSASVLQFAHARCADSQIIPIDADHPDRELFTDITAKPIVMQYATAPQWRALLVLEPRVEISEPTIAGDQVNLSISRLLEHGMTLMQTGGQIPDRAPGWRLIIHDADNIELLDPDRTIIYQG